ncbi:rhodopsin [Biomphalaria glabrata]|uniref:G-protein coupled receptors family 1 profile domain-containing protein n=1 Tax=Biomphalaria glabrata TaxID=6526 RepID=A0A2C9L154_BIOGL|nr:rhodopsin [Biomphalaria glabrata]
MKTMEDVAIGIENYYLYVLASIGIPANIFTILTILSLQSISPASFLVVMLAASDGCALISKVTIYHLQRFSRRGALCKLEFLTVFCTMMANWILVYICFERFISVCFPMKRLYLVTKKRTYIIVASTAAFLFVATAATYITVWDSHSLKCGMYVEYIWYWYHIWVKYLGPSLAVYLPFMLILIFTVAIIRALKIASRELRNLFKRSLSMRRSPDDKTFSFNEKNIAESEKLERMITWMMILAAIFFLIFTLPACVFFNLPEPGPESDVKSFTRYMLFEQIQHLCLDLTHTLNFFLYVVTAKRFRKQLVEILVCKTAREYWRKKRSEYAAKESQHTDVTHVDPEKENEVILCIACHGLSGVEAKQPLQ